MTMCKFPGCVAAARDGQSTCFVHGQKNIGTRCESCEGTGSRFYSGQNLTMACQYCGGLGLVNRLKRPAKPAVTPVDERGLIQLADRAEL